MAKEKLEGGSLKKIVKSAILEIIEENETLVSRILEGAIEDAFLSHAIKDGKKTAKSSRKKVFATLAQLSK
jgi:DNA gyrase/topoisomerase IV subunit B